MATDTVVSNKGWLRALAMMPIPPHSGIYKLHLQTKETIGSLSVRESVRLPTGLDRDEWIASQLCGIFEELEHLVNVMEDVCNEDTCPRMSAGKCVQYSWADERHTAPRALSAPEYMRTLIVYAEERLGDRKVVPIDGSAFPPEFMHMVKTLCKRFFRVYAHTYLSHFQVIQEQGAEGHLNCNFKHFLYFVLEFDLVGKQDMSPLAELIKMFLETDDRNRTKGKAKSEK
mmetsp:Transcript_75894/g.217262  ORF Transcript_75894/g.217262 Transcript_75894/m.217262 type:complete len:229 (-) Transcript_75894:263-949(-)